MPACVGALPGAQVLHATQAAAPGAAEKKPAAQDEHALEPAAAKEPAAPCAQTGLAVLEHCCDGALPAAHVAQAVQAAEEAFAAKKLAAHEVQLAAPSAADLPGGQAVQTTSDVCVPWVEGALPSGHVVKGEHAPAPAAALKVPAAQAVHELAKVPA